MTPEEREIERLKGNAYRNAWKRKKRAENPEATRAAARDYRARNLEKRREWERKWREQNPEKLKAYGRKSHYKNYLKQMIRQARQRAKVAGIGYDLTEEWVNARWTGKCELTGIEFSHPSQGRSQYSASLDRIDNSRGYTQDNCRLILWAVNKMKGEDTDETMFAIARALVSRAAN